jgi:hypothetical protein
MQRAPVNADVSWHMKRLDLDLTERAREYMREYLTMYAPESMFALEYGPSRWRFIVVTKDQAAEIEATSSITGEAIYTTNDGVKLLIPEGRDVVRLSGMTLDVANDVFTTSERAS